MRATPLTGVLFVAASALVGCGADEPTPSTVSSPAAAPTTSASSQVPTPSASAMPGSSSPTPTPATQASAGASSPSTAATPSGQPTVMRLGLGQTAHLRHVDVTLLRVAAGKDTVSQGLKVSVCHTHPHAGQNADGSTRISRDPWSVQVRDGEGGGSWRWMPVRSFAADPGWAPAFVDGPLRPGQCRTGWIAFHHGSPDLQFGDVRYQPADFGDDVTWEVS